MTLTHPTSPETDAPPATAADALAAIRAYTDSDNPSAFLAVSEGNRYFTAPGVPGLVVYRSAGNYDVQFGGPFTAPEHYTELLDAFTARSVAAGRDVVAIQLQRRDAELYAGAGFTVNQIGGSYAIDLSRFTLAGTKYMQLRNKIKRAHRSGLVIREVPQPEWDSAMRELDAVWLRDKGDEVKELEYLVGQYGGVMQEHRRLFVGTIDDQLAGYISYSPVYGSRAGWMHDLSRRIPDRTPGIMEAINKAAIDTFIAEGVAWLHFGFTPFTSLAESVEMPNASPGFAALMALLWEHGAEVYPAQTQLAYKQKWTQHLVLPEYIAFHGEADISGLVHVFRAAGAL